MKKIIVLYQTHLTDGPSVRGRAGEFSLIDKKLPDYEKTDILGRGSYIDMFKIKVRATHPGNSCFSGLLSSKSEALEMS